MKNILWNLIQKIFSLEIKQQMQMYADIEKINYYKTKSKEESIIKILKNYPVGTKIISQSNEPDDLLIATIVSHEIIPYGVILIAENSNGEQFTLLDKNPTYWNQEREDALRKLDWAERYNVLSKYHYYIDTETKKHKESQEYKNRLSA